MARRRKPSRKKHLRRPYTKTSDNILAKRSSRRAGGRGRTPDEDMSLLLRQDGAEDDNIASLLTEDYLKQFDIPIVFNDAVQYFVRYFTKEKGKYLPTGSGDRSAMSR